MKHQITSIYDIKEDMKPLYPPVTIGVPTKDRPNELCRLLAALHAQTYANWDLVIVDDSIGEMLNPEGEFWLKSISQHHRVIIQKGAQINQCYSHNHVLWSPNTNDLILRMDDDLVPDRDFLENLVDLWVESSKSFKMGAVGGLYFDNRNPRDDIPPRPTISHPDATVHRDGTAYAIAQMVDYSDNDAFEVEHIYSACLYSKKAMQAVGGWPLVYSDIVAHREETDGTYRLFLAGYKLLIDPRAKAKHEHGKAGGIRSISPSEHSQHREADERLWQKRIFKIRGVNYRPSVAVASYHTDETGGAQRLFYSLVSALQGTGLFERVVPIALGGHHLETYDAIKEKYGFNVHYLGERESNQPPWSLVEFDVVISMGHEPPDPKEIPARRHHIHYNLFPTMEFGLPRLVDRYVAISLYSGEYLKAIYRRNPEVIYPFVDAVEIKEELRKENEILLVGDVRRGKRMSHMVEAFLQMDLGNVKLHIVTPTLDESSGESSYLDVVSQDPRIEIHVDISNKELKELYMRCKVLWAGRGYNTLVPSLREHFGYTPVEAVYHYCIPIAYDAGGYQETTYLRWKTFEELEKLTQTVLYDRDEAMKALEENRKVIAQFSRRTFISDWVRVIMSQNSFAWDPQINEWRRSAAVSAVIDESIHIGCVSDSPYIPTGYGTIANQVYDGFLDQGYKLHVFAIRDHRADREDKYYRYWPTPADADSLDVPFRDFMHSHRFDAMWFGRDPYTASKFIQGARTFNATVPIVAFVSQEGSPAHRDWSHILNMSDEVITYSQSAAKAVYEKYDREIDWVYLGADHANFQVFEDKDRQMLRQRLGYDDRFTILNIARNTRNKRIPLLLKTAKILVDGYGYDDLILLLHTKQIGRAHFGGHDLTMWVESMQLERHVAFSPDLDLNLNTDIDSILSRPMFESFVERKEWFSELGMAGLYNLSDVYVDVSAAEGFCLPNLEAMACGVPVVSVDDGYVRSETLKGSAELVRPSRVPDEWNTGADLWLVDAQDVASAIHQIRTNAEKRDLMIECGLINAGKFKWDIVRAKMIRAIESCQKKW